MRLRRLDPDAPFAHAWLESGHFCWRQKVSALQCTPLPLSLSPPLPCLSASSPLHLSALLPPSHANSHLGGLSWGWYIIISRIFNRSLIPFHQAHLCTHFLRSIRLYVIPSPAVLPLMKANAVTSEGHFVQPVVWLQFCLCVSLFEDVIRMAVMGEDRLQTPIKPSHLCKMCKWRNYNDMICNDDASVRRRNITLGFDIFETRPENFIIFRLSLSVCMLLICSLAK